MAQKIISEPKSAEIKNFHVYLRKIINQIMENFIVSARKYRPDNFESVVGQDAITQTLKNSIKLNQLAQAYLFCGPRGVGKTTCARIFAKTINCSNLSSDFEACNECESCDSFNKQRSMNIYELDAASNNSVEDIRRIIDKIWITPQIGRYCVYIIDEVHMLSSQAFNAFLKTLEEPPKHVIFILATTEKHKIIPTILSRCQVFDFNRIGVKDISSQLEFVAQKENIISEQEALHVIAQKADGAMRDALSIFDQIVSFCGKNITYADTIKNLNVLDYEIYFKITDALLEGNFADALLIFDDVIRNGFEANYFINGLASHFRDVLVCKEPNTVNLLEVGGNIKNKYLEHAQKTSLYFLFNAIEYANQCDLSYKTSQNKRLLVELALLNMCDIGNPNVFSGETPKIETPAEKITAKETVNQPEEKPITVKGFSIKEIEKKVTAKEIIEETTELAYNPTENKDFDDKKLFVAWDKYAETQKNKLQLYTFLINNKPQKLEGKKYFIHVQSQTRKDFLDKLLNDTLQYIRTELQNNEFDLEYIIKEEEQAVKQFKTDAEKLKELIVENQNIEEMIIELKLDTQ